MSCKNIPPTFYKEIPDGEINIDNLEIGLSNYVKDKIVSDNIKILEESVFEGCRSLETADLPTKLVKIGRRAFKNCTSLASIILPIGVEAIGFDAFAGCSALSRIALPKDISNIEDEDVFSGCDSLSEISFGGTKDRWRELMSDKELTVKRSDGTVRSPAVRFMNFE